MSLFDRKSGFIGIEVVIIASLVMSFGALSANRFVQQGQSSTGAFDKAYEHTKNVVEGGEGLVDNEAEELPEEGEGSEPEIRYETKWYYGDMELPELPEEIKKYEWNAIGYLGGFQGVIASNRVPVFDCDYDADEDCSLVWYNTWEQPVKEVIYVLANGQWVKYAEREYSEGSVGFNAPKNSTDGYWTNLTIFDIKGETWLEGSQPEQKQVPIEE